MRSGLFRRNRSSAPPRRDASTDQLFRKFLDSLEVSALQFEAARGKLVGLIRDEQLPAAVGASALVHLRRIEKAITESIAAIEESR